MGSAETEQLDVRTPPNRGGEEAMKRDRIDRQAVQWMDSVLRLHSDDECTTHVSRWPHGPGGWGFAKEDIHVILLSPPRWDPRNTTVLHKDRNAARRSYIQNNPGDRESPMNDSTTSLVTEGSASPLPDLRLQAPSHPGNALP